MVTPGLILALISPRISGATGISDSIFCTLTGITVGAVCVYPNRVADCVNFLKRAGASHIPIASGTDSCHFFSHLNF